jgi:branched-chain amino acid transport system permease protein
MTARNAALAATMALLLAVPWVTSSNAWLSFWITTLLFGLLGQAWNILAGYGGQFSFGHALFFGTGAYATAILQIRYGVNAWVGALCGIAAAAAVGGFVGAVSFRSGLRGSYFALVTLAFAEVFRILANGLAFTGGAQGSLIPLNVSVANLQFADRRVFYYLIVALIGVGFALTTWLERSRFGAWLIAVRENEEAAASLGIDTFRVKLGAIMLSAALAGSAGVFYAQYFLFIDASIAYGPGVSVEALLGPIVGGLGTVLGPILGTILLHGLAQAAQRVVGEAPGLNLALYGLLLLIVLRFLPDGVMGLFARVTARHA